MLAADAGPRKKPGAKSAFGNPRAAEREYARRLKLIAKHIGDIIRGFPIGDPASLGPIVQAMHAYARTLDPWAKATAQRMLYDVNRQNAAGWAALSKGMSRALAAELRDTPIGEVMRALLASQVELITSLPIDAANRVHEWTQKGMLDGTRADAVAEAILQTADVTAGRAMLIARTETARTSTALTQARALHVGSEGYIWRTSRDGTVRPSPYDMSPKEFAKMNTTARGSHRLLEGTFHRWDQPPISGSAGERSHPGCIYNCRCYAEVVLPAR